MYVCQRSIVAGTFMGHLCAGSTGGLGAARQVETQPVTVASGFLGFYQELALLCPRAAMDSGRMGPKQGAFRANPGISPFSPIQFVKDFM
jgi:hypothetical protein